MWGIVYVIRNARTLGNRDTLCEFTTAQIISGHAIRSSSYILYTTAQLDSPPAAAQAH